MERPSMPGGTAIGFTGTRDVSPLQAQFIRERMDALPAADVYVSGACKGVDELVARTVVDRWPGARNVILVPRRPFVTPGFLDEMGLHASVEIVYMPAGTDYKARNQQIVSSSDRLIAFPAFPEGHPSSRRSGTWQTIRMARRAGKPVDLHILPTWSFDDD